MTEQQLTWIVSANVSRPRSCFWISVFSEMNWDFYWKKAEFRKREGWLWAGLGTNHMVAVKKYPGTVWRSQQDTGATQRSLYWLHLPGAIWVWESATIVDYHTARKEESESTVIQMMEEREMLFLNVECQLTSSEGLMGRWEQWRAELLLSESTEGPGWCRSVRSVCKFFIDCKGKVVEIAGRCCST